MMSRFRAIGLAEGYFEGTEDEVIEAWQVLVDSGLAWELQGWFGRQAVRLLQAGTISAPEGLPAGIQLQLGGKECS